MIVIRETTDIDLLMELRLEVIDSVFSHPSPEMMQSLAEANRDYYRRHLADGSHIALVALAPQGSPVGCGALCLYDEMPSPDNLSGRCAYIMNVYVSPAFRHQGIADRLIHKLIDRAKSAGADKIYLEATDMATPLYRSLGFHEMKNMMKYEDPDR